MKPNLLTKQKSMSVAAFFALSAVSVSAYAVDFGATISSQTEYRDNINKVNIDEEDDIEQTVSLALSADKKLSQVDILANYQLQESVYQQDSFDEEFVVTGSARVNWRILDDRLFWEFNNVRTNSLISSVEVDVPTNREEKNVFVTGPTWNYRITSVDVLALDLRYTDTNQEETEANDSERYRAGLNWKHTFSKTRSLTLSASQEEVHYDEDARNSDDSQVRLEYSTRSRKTTTRLSIGASRKDPEVGESNTEREYGADFRYIIASDKSLGLSVSQQYEDSSVGSTLSPFASITEDFADGDTGVSDTVLNNRAQLTYDHAFTSRSSVSINLTREDKDYDNEEDQLKKSGTVSLSHQVAEKVSFTASRKVEKIEELDRLDKEWQARISYNDRLMEELGFQASLFYESHKSDDQANEFDDFGLLLSFNYKLK